MKRILILTAGTLAMSCALAVAVAEKHSTEKNDGLCLVIVDDGSQFLREVATPIHALKFEAVISETSSMDFAPLALRKEEKASRQKQALGVPFLGINQMARPPNWRS